MKFLFALPILLLFVVAPAYADDFDGMQIGMTQTEIERRLSVYGPVSRTNNGQTYLSSGRFGVRLCGERVHSIYETMGSNIFSYLSLINQYEIQYGDFGNFSVIEGYGTNGNIVEQNGFYKWSLPNSQEITVRLVANTSGTVSFSRSIHSPCPQDG